MKTFQSLPVTNHFIRCRNAAGLLIFLLLCLACNKDIQRNQEAVEMKKILALHEQQRTFHFEKMAEEFASLLSENHISVNRGEIKSPTTAENTERFKNYFKSVEFEKWDDVQPPTVRFSDDFSLAYTIVNKEVVVTYKDENDQHHRELTEFSWVAIYKKYSDGWKIDCVASTNKPSVEIN